MSELTVQQKVENAIKWIDTLDTTDLKQGKGKLGNERLGFCCLGLAACCAGIDYDYKNSLLPKGSDYNMGLSSYAGSPKDEVVFNILWKLNDRGISFSEIGRIVKKHPEQYFIPEVAEKLKEHYA